MNWERIDRYAWETLGQVRRTPITETEKIGGDGRPYDAKEKEANDD